MYIKIFVRRSFHLFREKKSPIPSLSCLFLVLISYPSLSQLGWTSFIGVGHLIDKSICTGTCLCGYIILCTRVFVILGSWIFYVCVQFALPPRLLIVCSMIICIKIVNVSSYLSWMEPATEGTFMVLTMFSSWRCIVLSMLYGHAFVYVLQVDVHIYVQ